MRDLKMPTLNRVLITGNLVRDPELRKTAGGVPVSNFRMASTRHFWVGDERREQTCYIGVVVWDRLAESCFKCLRQSSAVLVEGELQSNAWTDSQGQKRQQVEINAFRVQFLDRPPRQEQGDEGYDDRDQDGAGSDDGYEPNQEPIEPDDQR